MLHAQSTVTITDTIKTPMGGNWSGTVQVTLNNPATAQPLYAGSETLSGWSQTVTVTNGAFSISLYANDAITPTGTSYTARYTPTSGSSWSETWVCPTGATTIRELRSTTVPTPRTMFTPSQITQASATLGQALRWNGSTWAPAAVLTDPMTSTGDLITRSGGVPVRVGIGSTGQVLTVAGGLPTWAAPATNGTVTGVSVTTANGVSGTVANSTTTPAITLSLGAITPTSVAASGTVTGSNLSGTNTGDQTTITGNAGTATALAANPANCAAGTFPLGVSAAGAAEDCTALPTTITGTANQITASAATGAVTLSIPTNPTLPGTTTGTFSGNLTGNVTGNVTGSSGSTTGNAATATALQTARTIAGVNFNGTANISIPSTGLSDSSDIVRGGASVATGQVLYGTGAGVAGTNANLFWDNANGRLGVGTNAPASAIEVSAPVSGSLPDLFRVTNSATAANQNRAEILLKTSGGAVTAANQARIRAIMNPSLVTDLGFFTNSIQNATLTSTGNLLLNTTTDDGSNRLQVAGSVRLAGTSPAFRLRDTVGGTADFSMLASNNTIALNRDGIATLGRIDYLNGTFTWYNEIPTTGVTQLVVRAGAGQGSTSLTTWQNAAGTAGARILNGGDGIQATGRIDLTGPAFADGWTSLTSVGIEFRNAAAVAWSSGAASAGTKDASLSRASAGVLQVGDGAANANGSFRGGFISQDGTTGVTVTTCTGFKNGLCISGT
jgi:hypothetical protein